MFKLKSIGVRVEGDDAQIDTDILQAILQGKKLTPAREVILRDGEDDTNATTAAQLRRRPLPSKAPVNPLRPKRPRTMINRVEPSIKTLPASERAKPKPEPEPAKPAAEAKPAPAPEPKKE
ncbi:MAG: hypothetical protein SX243_23225, partial [Acidobacteriota bacterium]|nr:hypothetical protein [Acidobacteriota bacterium]